MIHFSEEESFILWGILIQDLKLFATKHLIDNFKLSHKERICKTEVRENGSKAKIRRIKKE